MRSVPTVGGISRPKVSSNMRSAVGSRADFRKEDYILADESTDVGELIASFDWGDADSTPPLVAKGLCNA